MAKSLQLAVLAVAVGLAGSLWLARDQVAQAVSRLTDRGTGAPKATGPKTAGRSLPVIVQQVTTRSDDEVVSAVGTARAERSVMIHAKSDGVIMTFGPKAGDRVARGQTLFQLDATKAQLAVDIATRDAEEARRQLARVERLERRNVNSSASVEDARTVAQRAELRLRQASANLADLTITAPFDGVVGLPKVEVGERITSAMSVISLDRRRRILVEFEVPEKLLSRLKEGSTISAMTPSQADRTFTGLLQHLDSRVDPTSRTATLRAVIDNEDDLLRPGMSFVLETVLRGRDYPAVPELALQWRKGRSFVWLVRAEKADKVFVRVVQRLNGTVLVDGKLARGELVVVEGVQRLRPGSNVSYREPEDAQPSSSGLQRPQKATSPGKG